MEDKRYALNTTGNVGTESRIILSAGDTTFAFLQSGDLFEITHGDVMINQIRGNMVDGSMNNIYLRVYEDDAIKTVTPLLGIASVSEFSYDTKTNSAKYIGEVDDIRYEVIFQLTATGNWFWTIQVEAGANQVDLLYGQDVGLASRGMLQSNEAYTSQYVDYKVFDDDSYGFTVCSRQNQPQGGGKFPYLQQGSLTTAISYSTDGYQFYGLSYKETDYPESYFTPRLANEVYQYEFGFVGLSSEMQAGSINEVFYGLVKDNQSTKIIAPVDIEDIEDSYESLSTDYSFVSPQLVSTKENFDFPLEVNELSTSEIDELYPERIQEEFDGNTLLSFFLPTYEHVVLKEKEMRVERSHGHLIFSGDSLVADETVLSTTSYMFGVFNAQIVVGNTTMNKFTSNARNGLNVLKTSGQRIYVEIDGFYRLLTMPSAYEMGFNYAKWIYKTEDETFLVKNFTSNVGSSVTLTVESLSGKKYRYIVTNQVVMNEKEYEVPFRMAVHEKTLTFKTVENGFVSNYYPDLTYHLHVDGAKFNVGDERLILEGVKEPSASLVVLEVDKTNTFKVIVEGLINGGSYTNPQLDFNKTVGNFRKHFKQTMNDFNLTLNNQYHSEIEKLNITAWWYTHNMFVHYLVPHGLEQYGGAAWGTRDVCQGPFEYFLAMGHNDVMKDIILKVFSHQFENDGNWPQWFMFDKYVNIQAGESHGDIIAWPLYIIATYLNTTQDFTILDEQIPYMDRSTFAFTQHTESLMDHIRKEITYIKNHFLHDTHLSCYDDGDWDDTLQPHDQLLKKYMASTWTVGLTYKGMNLFARAINELMPNEANEIESLARGIEKDFRDYIMTSDIIPGFLYLEDSRNPEFMIHPTDEKLGIDYRLLPMQQSIISELFTHDEAIHHLKIIRENLQCPDGVRLMSRPAHYDGGVSSKFKRAEQAANFGREVGLQYVHAHIRFIEAMAKMGEADEVWNGLFVINPINIIDRVENAELRQSNAYFSSSDGKFNDRYQAEAEFDKLKTGDVAVKGGWRVYSSGPGIYLNQVISNVLGLRSSGEKIIIDPILPRDLDGLKFEFSIGDVPISIVYHLFASEKKILLNNEVVAVENIANKYREGGLAFNKNLLNNSSNEIEIFLT